MAEAGSVSRSHSIILSYLSIRFNIRDFVATQAQDVDLRKSGVSFPMRVSFWLAIKTLVWKPDRTAQDWEIERCVRKVDLFCTW